MNNNLIFLAVLFSMIVIIGGCQSNAPQNPPNQQTTTPITTNPTQNTITANLIAKVSDVPTGSMLKFDYKGEQAMLVNFNGDFKAFVNKCPHKGLAFDEKSLSGDKITCPWHGSQFDPTTGAYLGNTKGENLGLSGLTMIDIQVKDGNIYSK